jgi:hypothetical protein
MLGWPGRVVTFAQGVVAGQRDFLYSSRLYSAGVTDPGRMDGPAQPGLVDGQSAASTWRRPWMDLEVTLNFDRRFLRRGWLLLEHAALGGCRAGLGGRHAASWQAIPLNPFVFGLPRLRRLHLRLWSLSLVPVYVRFSLPIPSSISLLAAPPPPPRQSSTATSTICSAPLKACKFPTIRPCSSSPCSI